MRPLKLTMTAFGPYARTQVIDFTVLGSRTFFLVHGPTGSGKSTILDAMCFALFGDTSTEKRDGKKMRSDHADPNLVTEVIFDFSLGYKHYRVSRIPEQQVTGKRKNKLVTKKPTATLWDISGSPNNENCKVIASNYTETTKKIESILGLKSEQFRQVVLLPQGQFQKLLKSDSRDREKILETLFKTEKFKRIEEKLKDSAKKLRVHVEKIIEKQRWLLDQAQVDNQQELVQFVESLEFEKTRVKSKLDNLKLELKETQNNFNSALKLIDLVKEKEAAEKLFKDLQRKEPIIQEKEAFCKNVQKASRIVELEQALKTRETERKKTETTLSKYLLEMETSEKLFHEAKIKLKLQENYEPDRIETQNKIHDLEKFTAKVQQLDRSYKLFNPLQSRVEKLKGKLAQLNESRANLEKKLEQTRLERDQSLDQKSKIPELKTQLTLLEKQFASRSKMESIKIELTSVKSKYEIALTNLANLEKTIVNLESEHMELLYRWSKGQAAILATTLVDGEPCPVCGSKQHPSPVESKEHLPSQSELDKKQNILVSKKKDKEKLITETNELKSIIDNLSGKLSTLEHELGEHSNIPIDLLESQLSHLQKEFEKTRDIEQNAVNLDNTVKELIIQVKEKELACNNLREQIHEHENKLTAVKQTIQLFETEIPENLRNIKSLKQAISLARENYNNMVRELEDAKKNSEQWKQEVVKLKTMVGQSKKNLESLTAKHDAEKKEFDKKLQAVGFEKFSEYENARNNIDNITNLETEINKYYQELHSAKDRYTRAAETSKNLIIPDIEMLERKVNQTQEQYDETMKRYARLNDRINQNKGYLQQLDVLTTDILELESRFGILGMLSDVANGKNDYGMTFQRFVLGTLLDDVTIAATKRLVVMSQGRYQLQRTFDRVRKNAAGGLDLQVYDTYTGILRSVFTLSGGETFLASLSLALGLADIVQSYAGGIHLETIFIDEGFGSLDPESLDFALRALIDLQKGGRLVGIISHVPELQERIDARLEIISSENGSVARFNFS